MTLVLLLHKTSGPISLEVVKEVTDFIIREGDGGVSIYESGNYMFSLDRIKDYPELFRKEIDQDGVITFSRSGDLVPKLEYFFATYPLGFMDYWYRLVSDYVDKEIAEGEKFPRKKTKKD